MQRCSNVLSHTLKVADLFIGQRSATIDCCDRRSSRSVERTARWNTCGDHFANRSLCRQHLIRHQPGSFASSSPRNQSISQGRPRRIAMTCAVAVVMESKPSHCLPRQAVVMQTCAESADAAHCFHQRHHAWLDPWRSHEIQAADRPRHLQKPCRMTAPPAGQHIFADRGTQDRDVVSMTRLSEVAILQVIATLTDKSRA